MTKQLVMPFASDVTPGWIHTRSGNQVWPLIASGGVVSSDVVHALAHTCRWAGHTPHFYSVAKHAVLVAMLAEENDQSADVILACLHHDDAEAYLPDLPSPIKSSVWVETPDGFKSWSEIEAQLMRKILVAWDLPSDLCKRHKERVKVYDRQALAIEAAALMHGTDDWDWQPDLPYDADRWIDRVRRIKSTPKEDASAYLALHDELLLY